MRMLALFAVAAVWPLGTSAASPQHLYFVGEVKLSAPDGKPMESQVILLHKTHEPDESTIIERAIIVKPDGTVDDQTMRLTVAEDGAFTLVDEAGKIDGKGRLFGPAWAWTYFDATYKHESGVTVEDENFMTDDSVITARKKVSAPNGSVILYMEMSLKGITRETFEILAAGLKKG